jgi:uncharacterized membrane protein YfcA
MNQYIQSILSWLKALLADGSQVSAMRVMAFMSLFAGIGLAFTGLQEGKNLGELSTLVGVFVGAAFGGKVVQKFAEIKEETKNKSE